jgi:hypothetical protein
LAHWELLRQKTKIIQK